MTPTAPAAALRRTTLPRAAGPVLAALLLALVALLATAPRAAAHNSLLGTDPEDGATVAAPPARVTLTFDQPAQAIGTEVVVLGPDGGTVSTGTPELVDSTVAQALVDDLPAGVYTVQWRVTSADGHPLSGELTFTASAPTPPQAAEPEAPSSAPPAEPEPTSTTAGGPGATAATLSPQQEVVEDEDAGLEAGVVAVVVVAVLAAGAVAVFVVRERRRSAAGRAASGGDGGGEDEGHDGDADRDGRAER
ncbi:copper resistance CopC family protein [Cellulomonas sp. C5510]|uniref:copper resistance CopC family protein n=1 Tax=Cellulomonas sp. C5510 TaxID=2871170 RepID=UPI001C947856|nr:copper resistance CopC family protein [Cellulomonas sp. C5510]QZN85563.1 copper resistance protein CopC [Cellulomonas sp. C5510]